MDELSQAAISTWRMQLNRNGKYYRDRLGAACDFRIVGIESDRLLADFIDRHGSTLERLDYLPPEITTGL